MTPHSIERPNRILVVGAGATGGFFGARLAQHGRDVTFLVRPRRAEVLRAHGLRITGLGGEEVSTPRLVTAAELDSTYDVVLLSVKATGLAQALDDVAPAIGADTTVVPFLNGLEHLRMLNDRFGRSAVLGGVVKVFTTVAADGTIVQFAPVASITIGEQTGEPTARLAEVANLLSGAGFDLDVSADIVSAMWHKWVFITSIGALTCLFRGTVGEIVAVPGGADIGLAILAEAAAVSAAAGHPVPPETLGATAGVLTAPGSATVSSMFRDLQAGQPTEVEHILGDLLNRARSFDVATPLLDLATLGLRVHQRRSDAAEAGG